MLLQRLEAVLVTGRDREAVALRAVPEREPLGPALLARRPDDVAAALEALAEFGALEYAALELKLSQMLLDRLQVVVRELLGKHAEESREALRTEAGRVLVGDLPQPPEHVGVEFQYAHRAAEDLIWTGSEPDAADRPLVFERFDRELIQLADDLGVRKAVREHVLPIDDGVRIGQARQDGPLGHLEQELVPGRHRVPQRPEFEVLREHRVVASRRERRAGLLLPLTVPPDAGEREQVTAAHRVEHLVVQFRPDGEVPVPVQQEDLHQPIRSSSRS
jgi:hypothetical protein